MPCAKSPRVDVILVVFYSAFWPLLAADFMAHMAELPLLYVSGGRRGDLSNWWPIVLLSVDYKLLAKALVIQQKSLPLGSAKTPDSGVLLRA